MTQAEQILNDLTRRGVTLQTDGERLTFQPASAVDPPTVERLREHKAELIQLLKIQSTTQVTKDRSPNFICKTDLVSYGSGISGDPDADSIIRETWRRVNEAFPSNIDAVDWHEIDRWHWALNEARRCDDLPGLRAVAAEFEREMQRMYPPRQPRC